MNLNPLELFEPETTENIMSPFTKVKERLERAINQRNDNIGKRDARIATLLDQNTKADEENERAGKALTQIENILNSI